MNRGLCANLISIAIIIACISGCSGVPEYSSFLTGECLESESLSTKLNIENNSLTFYFKPIFSYKEEYSRAEGFVPTMQGIKDTKVMPSPAIFSAFGSQISVVRKEYDRLYDDFLVHSVSGHITTIFYHDGMTLTADKEFAGHKAGENLIPFGNILNNGSALVPKGICYIPLLENFEANYMVSPNPQRPFFSFSIDGHEIEDEDVTFILKVPVKAVMYLNWLNDRSKNPNATIPVEELVLTGTFNIGKGLR